MNTEENFEFDDEAAVAFIQNYLPEELRQKFSEDAIYYLLDTICDFYDKYDGLDEDDFEKEEEELKKYLIAQAKQDEIGVFSEEDMMLFLRAEEAYSDTLGVF